MIILNLCALIICYKNDESEDTFFRKLKSSAPWWSITKTPTGPDHEGAVYFIISIIVTVFTARI